jgi:hypothetical protein
MSSGSRGWATAAEATAAAAIAAGASLRNIVGGFLPGSCRPVTCTLGRFPATALATLFISEQTGCAKLTSRIPTIGGADWGRIREL